MAVELVDRRTREALALQYQLHGRVLTGDVLLPRDFQPRRTSVAFVRKGGHCEVYFDASVRYLGTNDQWRTALQRPPHPGDFRLVTTVPGDLSDAVTALEAALQIAEEDQPLETDTEAGLHLRDLVLEQKGAPRRLAGRDELVRAVKTSLLRESKPGVLLLGEPGVGKTALVTMVAWDLANGHAAPPALAGTRIYDLPLGSLLEGSQAVGDLERQVRELVHARGRPVLFVDEVHQLARPELAPLRDLLKPALAAGTTRVIAATTPKEWRRVEDDAFKRRFTELTVPEPGLGEVASMIAPRVPGLAAHHGLSIEDPQLNEAIVLADRFLPLHHFPDKAIDVLDLAGAMQSVDTPAESEDTAALRSRYLREAVSRQSGLPESFVDPAGHSALLTATEESLRSRLIGQDEVIEHLVKTLSSRLAVRRIGWNKAVAELLPTEDKRPLAAVLACGPTGVGKTETARMVAEAFFGGSLIVLNGSDAGPEAPHGTAMWTGSPPGYIGSQNGGVLSDGLRATPAAVILVDEIEKASAEAVQNILLPLLGDGIVTDRNTGESLFATQCVIFCTSNLPLQPAHAVERSDGPNGREDNLRAALRRYLRPEIIGRFNAVLDYAPLSVETQWQVFESLMRDIERKSGIDGEVTLSPGARRWVAERLSNNPSGARGVQDLFRMAIVPLVADMSQGAPRSVGLRNGALVVAAEEEEHSPPLANCHIDALPSVH
jgi:ATP-dependent Clp protease ATP-binding subunit ClpA